MPEDRAFVQVVGLGDLIQKLSKDNAEKAGKAAISTLRTLGIYIRDDAKRYCPVETGRLRASITSTDPYVNAGLVMVDIGTDVEYACVFGRRTPVLTQDGTKGIGDVEVGDLVLTQAGDFQPVTATTMYVVEHPDLVEVRYRWRAAGSGRTSGTRKVTVTPDHPLLSFVDGRWKWVEAKDLRRDSILAVAKKLAHNRGQRSRPMYECSWCGKRHRGQGDKYCTPECRDEAWRAGANPHLGAKRSEESRRRMSVAAKLTGPGRVRNFLKWSDTKPEMAIESWLRGRDINYEKQAHIGGRVVDFFVPEQGLALEADGAYWHQDQASDVRRDEDLMKDARCRRVVHVHFHDPRFSPILDPRPMPGVRYVSCNPGPETYVDIDRFRPVRVESVTRFRYDHRKGCSAVLYDLTVKGCHSFVLGGVVSSNTFVEFGTGRRGAQGQTKGFPIGEMARRFMTFVGYVYGAGKKRPNSEGMPAQPFLFPALEKWMPLIPAYFLKAVVGILTGEGKKTP